MHGGTGNLDRGGPTGRKGDKGRSEDLEGAKGRGRGPSPSSHRGDVEKTLGPKRSIGRLR